MRVIIGGFLTPLNSSRTMGSVRRRDDNSRRKVQNVYGDSSASNLLDQGVLGHRGSLRLFVAPVDDGHGYNIAVPVFVPVAWVLTVI